MALPTILAEHKEIPDAYRRSHGRPSPRSKARNGYVPPSASFMTVETKGTIITETGIKVVDRTTASGCPGQRIYPAQPDSQWVQSVLTFRHPPSTKPRHTSKMGGNAFSERLPTAVFPRMSPAFYNSLKARIIPRLEALYHLVTVPPEAPGKIDHGDLDILVCQPKHIREGVPLSECVTFAEIEQALGSAHSLPLPGDRTSNFAIPIQQDEVQYFSSDQKVIGEGRLDLAQLYIQVDLHFCEDLESWKSRILFQSYGELGMILGMLARVVKLTWTVAGLKVLRCHCFGICLLTRPSAFSLRHLYPRPSVYPPDNFAPPNLRVFRSRSRCSRTRIHHGPGGVRLGCGFQILQPSPITPCHEEPQIQRRKEDASGILGLPRVAHRLRRAKGAFGRSRHPR